MIKAIIFDMDGLLIDSEPIWQEVEIKTFNEVGVPLTKEKSKETMGLRVDEVVEHWFSNYPWKEPTKKEIERKIVEGVIALVKEKGMARPGAEKIVKLFADQNFPIAIASSSQMEIIKAVLERISIRKYIKIIHSAEHELYGKPDPAVYITTAKKMGVLPEDCLAFEDSPNGVLAAKAAKIKCVAVPDQTMKDNKIFSIADMVVDSLEEFSLDYLAKFN
jgi:sugar-phosphatase